MKPVFLDTVGLLALRDVADQWHSAANAAFAQLVASKSSLLTTSFILLERGNASVRRPYRLEASRLRATLEQRGELIVPKCEVWRRGWEAYDSGTVGQAGIVDCVSYAVMRRVGLTQAFTNDRHFRDAGFETLF
jgi:predicted nucleic acid-binding protein